MKMVLRSLAERAGRCCLLLAAAVALGSCASTPAPTCELPQQRDLAAAIDEAQHSLAQGCETRFQAYLDALLEIAEGDPGSDNKAQFSEFLVWVSEQGILNRRQAQELYNRYFNVKFVSLLGDYNNCAYSCPRQDQLLDRMQQELADKERGLLKISEDRDGYYRADRLLKETELVLAATCTACTTVP